MKSIKEKIKEIDLDITIRRYLKSHTVIATRQSVILTTPSGRGKIEITDKEIVINPQLEAK